MYRGIICGLALTLDRLSLQRNVNRFTPFPIAAVYRSLHVIASGIRAFSTIFPLTFIPWCSYLRIVVKRTRGKLNMGGFGRLGEIEMLESEAGQAGDPVLQVEATEFKGSGQRCPCR